MTVVARLTRQCPLVCDVCDIQTVEFSLALDAPVVRPPAGWRFVTLEDDMTVFWCPECVRRGIDTGVLLVENR